MPRLLVGMLLLSMLDTICASAKRVPPKDVPPVVVNGVQYSADGDGRDSYAVATDVATGKELWRVKVFHTRIKFWREEDNQWLFISDLKVDGNSLFVRDEKNRCYSIHLNTKDVKKAQCRNVFPSQRATTLTVKHLHATQTVTSHAI